jgi:hypothetical protein
MQFMVMNLQCNIPANTNTSGKDRLVGDGLVLGVDNPVVLPLQVYQTWKGEYSTKVGGTNFGLGKTIQESINMALGFLPNMYR